MSGRIKFRAYADASCCFWVEVRVFENRRDMCRDIRRCAGAGEPREAHHKRFQTAGQVNGATFYRGGKKTGAFAVMWLNRKDILKTPSEIAAHEATHAPFAISSAEAGRFVCTKKPGMAHRTFTSVALRNGWPTR